MMGKIKIFISSVQSEFAEERQALAEFLRADPLLGKFFEPFQHIGADCGCDHNMSTGYFHIHDEYPFQVEYSSSS